MIRRFVQWVGGGIQRIFARLWALTVAICALPLRFLRAVWEATKPAEAVKEQRPILDLYQQAIAMGGVTENQYMGLGHVKIAPRGTAYLEATVNRNLWAKALVLDTRHAPDLVVTGVTLAGLPMNIGSEGAPVSIFQAARGVYMNRRALLAGQRVRVSIENISDQERQISGGLVCDELSSHVMQELWERVLVQAATDMANGR